MKPLWQEKEDNSVVEPT